MCMLRIRFSDQPRCDEKSSEYCMTYTLWAAVGRYVAAQFGFFFFFQAEDGIRDLTVTGVQTCALPISMLPVGGRPLMARIIERLKQAGIRRVNVMTHYKPEKIIEYFRDGDAFGVEIGRASCRERV